MQVSDIIVIGGGIAGLSAAAELANTARVTVLEMEPQPGFHASSRSAAFFAAAYGKKITRDFTACCEAFFFGPPDGFTEVPLIHARDCMFFGREDQADKLQAMQNDNPRLQFLDADAVRERVPVLSPEYLYGAVWDRMGGDLDVDALLQGYVRQFRRRGGSLLKDHRVDRLERRQGVWRLTAGSDQFEASLVVNAAGAWAEQIANLAGLEPIGIKPYRRTALTIDPPDGVDPGTWPLMIDAYEDFYFKPEAGKIMISPADETATPPCDAMPEDLDVATGIYRFEQATGLEIQRVSHKWAGLRTFSPDRNFVVGFDPRVEGFFWLAGQGGAGVMTAPSLAHLSDCLINGKEPAGDLSVVGNYVNEVAPDRFIESK